MSEPFLAEVRMVGFSFAPRGWAFCDGQLLPINQNQSLFSLLGTTYGGDGRTTLALPDLRGRTPIHVGASNGTDHSLGQKSGAETDTLARSQMPGHTHEVKASATVADASSPSGNVLAQTETEMMYHNPSGVPETTMNNATIPTVGGSQSHDNMQPYLVVNFCIALRGLFPSRN